MSGQGRTANMSEVRPSANGGNGLFATKDLDVGMVAMRCKRPLALALDSKRLKDTCGNCLAWTSQSRLGDRGALDGGLKVKACTGCGMLRYCSKECQRIDWKRYHRIECAILKKTAAKGIMPNAARLVIHMLQSSSSWDSSPWRGMISHLSEIVHDPQRWTHLLALSTGVFKYTGETHRLELIQTLMGIVFVNALTLYTATFDPLGICVDPLACSANHSCDPNVSLEFDGSIMTFRTIRAVKEDQELLLPYVDATDPFYRRQALLKERYYFACHCKKCLAGPGQREDLFTHELASMPPKIATTVTELAESMPFRFNAESNPISKSDSDFIGPGIIEDALSTIQKKAFVVVEDNASKSDKRKRLKALDVALGNCLKTKTWPETRQPIPALRQEIFLNLLMLGKWSVAFRYGLHIYFNIHPVLYPQTFYPARVVHQWTLAKLALYLADNQQWPDVQELMSEGVNFGIAVLGLMIQAHENIALSHGNESSFARHVKGKWQELMDDVTQRGPDKLNTIRAGMEDHWDVLRNIAELNKLELVEIM